MQAASKSTLCALSKGARCQPRVATCSSIVARACNLRPCHASIAGWWRALGPLPGSAGVVDAPKVWLQRFAKSLAVLHTCGLHSTGAAQLCTAGLQHWCALLTDRPRSAAPRLGPGPWCSDVCRLVTHACSASHVPACTHCSRNPRNAPRNAHHARGRGSSSGCPTSHRPYLHSGSTQQAVPSRVYTGKMARPHNAV